MTLKEYLTENKGKSMALGAEKGSSFFYIGDITDDTPKELAKIIREYVRSYKKEQKQLAYEKDNFDLYWGAQQDRRLNSLTERYEKKMRLLDEKQEKIESTQYGEYKQINIAKIDKKRESTTSKYEYDRMVIMKSIVKNKSKRMNYLNIRLKTLEKNINFIETHPILERKIKSIYPNLLDPTNEPRVYIEGYEVGKWWFREEFERGYVDDSSYEEEPIL